MKYIANQDIGDYKKGDEVPEDIASVWMQMYKFPPVDKEKTQKSKSISKKIPEQPGEEKSIFESVKKSLSSNKKG